MIARALGWAAVACSALVAIGFILFAVDQARTSSKRQQAVIEGTAAPAPAPTVERERERRSSGVRELVDDANDVLLAPFAWAAPGDDIWAERGVPALVALLVYGLGLGLLASYARALP